MTLLEDSGNAINPFEFIHKRLVVLSYQHIVGLKLG